jgi:hypothetical protein
VSDENPPLKDAEGTAFTVIAGTREYIVMGDEMWFNNVGLWLRITGTKYSMRSGESRVMFLPYHAITMVFQTNATPVGYHPWLEKENADDANN